LHPGHDSDWYLSAVQIFIVVGLSAYVTYRYELNSRIIYALENEKVQILYDLSKKKSYTWQLVLELFVMCVLSWHVACMSQQFFLGLFTE